MSNLLFKVVAELLERETDDARESVLNYYNRIFALAETVDRDYEPTRQSASRFADRAGVFVSSGPSAQDRRLLLQLLAETAFVDSALFSGLLAVAHQDRVLPWLVKREGLSHASPTLESELDAALQDTIFISLTDSFPVSQYVHENSVRSTRWRPDLRSLRAFSTAENVASRISQEGYRFVVVLEDFVGSGTQSSGPLKFLAQSVRELPILIVPLVICHQGLTEWSSRLGEATNISIDPVMTLHREDLLAEGDEGRTDSIAVDYRRILLALDDMVNADADAAYPGYLGFGGIGALYVRYSNCPNNAVSALHTASSRWVPPFPRAARWP